MIERPVQHGRVPPVQRIEKVNDLYDITFSEDGLAAVEVPIRLLDSLPLVGGTRSPGPRLKAMVSLMRRQGHGPAEPIICRIGMKGRWVVVDGGHRITAARIVARDFWARLFGRRIETLHFLLFTTPESWSKLRPNNTERPDAGAAGDGTDTMRRHAPA